MELFIVVIYTLSLLFIFLYSLAQLNLLFGYIKAKKHTPENIEVFNLTQDSETPFITIQLPVYNELYVMERLLNNIAKVDYPKNKLEIQVLDDSTDESVLSTKKHINQLRKNGLDIVHIHRTDRQGFKAGALKEGLAIAKGEFIAIFDADFLPKSDWLKQTIPYFKSPKIGVVQTRWGHTNRNYSLLTQIQAFALDFHFTMEQVGRNNKNHFINFNGTAGVWRKACIEDAGNWQGDTLTEDLDLSYRAQLKNWEFKYLEQVETPAELPVVISAARSQQFRWNKGAAENFKKLFKSVVKNKNISLGTKIHSFFHLLNSSMFVIILLISLLSLPILFIKSHNPVYAWYFNLMAFFALSTVIFFSCYWTSFKNIHGSGTKNFFKFLKLFVTFFSIAMGFSIHNSVAVLEGHIGKRSEFVRTPKFNLESLSNGLKSNKYINRNISINTIFEALLMLYFGYALYVGYSINEYGFFIFHGMLFFGFGFVFFKSVTAKI